MTERPKFMILYTVCAFEGDQADQKGATIEIAASTDFALMEAPMQRSAVRATIKELQRVEKKFARKAKEESSHD
jgi:hypothetical protein